MILCIACVMYVTSLLRDYEDSQPEKKVEEAIAILSRDAADGSIWKSIKFPEIEAGPFESEIDLKSEYTKLLTSEGLEYSAAHGIHAEDELVYNVTSNGFVLAEVTLKAVGEQVTKLAVFTSREWRIHSVRPILEEHEYTISVPTDFTVKVNGTELTDKDGTASGDTGFDYKISGIYLKPTFHIADTAGNVAKYSFKGSRVIPELYNYSLTLPASLSVELNGTPHDGEKLTDGRVKHDIRLLTKPIVKISDKFGNIVNYEGGNDLPLTYMNVTLTDKHSITVGGASVPASAVKDVQNPDYEAIKPYVSDLPALKEYDIAVLKNGMDIVIKDGNGQIVEFDKNLKKLDLTKPVGLDSVPSEIAAEVDVLQIAKNWSLFTSQDLSFYTMATSLIPSSYQYEVATKYANGIDITFTSIHTLLDPPFTEESVKNFVWITDDCFSVDISFVKHMLLSDGQLVDVPMNDTFYFVKYDDPYNDYDSLTWKFASMKVVVDDAE